MIRTLLPVALVVILALAFPPLAFAIAIFWCLGRLGGSSVATSGD